MAEKRIEIQMAAVGAPEAAAAIQQSADAVKELTTAQGDSFEQLQKQVAADAEAAKERAAQARERSAQAETEAEELRKSVAHHESRGKEIAKANQAIAAAAKVAGGALAEVARAIDSVDLERLNRLDPKTSEEFKNISFWAKAATSPVEALIEKTSELFLGDTVGEAFEAMNEALAKAAEDHVATIDKMIQSGIRQTDEIKRLADEVKAANAILDAKDSADAAERKRSNAARVRAGEPQEQVDKEQAAYEASKEVEKIERQRAAADAEAVVAMLEADQVRTNAQAVDADGASTQEDRRKANTAAKAAQARAREMIYQAATARRIANERTREVRANEAAKFEEIDATAASKFERDYDQFAAGFESEEKNFLAGERDEGKRRAAALPGKIKATQGQLQESSAETAYQMKVAAGNTSNKALRGSLIGISNELEDGTSAAEIAQLQQQFSKATARFGGTTVASLQKMLAELETQAKRIEVVESQIKNARRGR